MEKWIGYNVSVECGSPLGVYQGSILAADGSSITLTKAFRNGFPYPEPRLTIKAADIKDLKIIEPKREDDSTQSSIEVVKTNKKQHRSTVSENLQTAGSSTKRPSNTNQGNKNTNGYQYQRSKPIEIQRHNTNTHSHNSYNNFSGGNGNAGLTPKGKISQHRQNNFETFGTSGDDPSLMQDFDFEKNLALFDKQAMWEQLKNSNKPDLVRQTDKANRKSNTKLAHNENVLSSAPAVYRPIHVPEDMRGSVEYVTDEGVVVPSVTPQLRQSLWDSLENVGLHHNVPTLLARAAVDIALRLLGGERRLDPRNAHQVPTVVILVGPHKEGQAGITCARILASHGVSTVVHVTGRAPHTAVLTHLAQYQLAGPPHRTAAVPELPSADLIIAALASHSHHHPHEYREAVEWASKSRAAVMALDPPAGGTEGLVAKVSVLAALPLSYIPEHGQLYLANLSVPGMLLKELGLTYKSPFGAKNVVPLYPSTHRL